MFASWVQFLVGELTLSTSQIHHPQTPKRCRGLLKTEIDVAKYFPQDKVFGVYPGGGDETQQIWSNHFTYWKKLRDEQSFPALKNSNMTAFESILVSRERPQGDLTTRCITKCRYAVESNKK